MEFAYNMGIIRALDDLGIAKFSNEQIAQEVASGSEPQELQAVADSKLTEKDIEGAAKVVQVMAQMKQMSDQQGYVPAEMGGQGGGMPGMQTAPMPGASQVPPAPMNQGMGQGAMPPQGGGAPMQQPPMGMQGGMQGGMPGQF